MTASPAELRLMLFDGAIKFLEQGKEGLEKKDYEQSYNGISRCQAILIELLNSLQPQHAPELCQQLSSLYTFMYTRLVEASTERDVGKAEQVLELLRYERETWLLLMENLASENASGAAAADAVAEHTIPAAPGGDQAGRDKAATLVGGQASLQG